MERCTVRERLVLRGAPARHGRCMVRGRRSGGGLHGSSTTVASTASIHVTPSSSASTTTHRSRRESAAGTSFAVPPTFGFQTRESPGGSPRVRPIQLCISDTTDAPRGPRIFHGRSLSVSRENGLPHIASPSLALVPRKIGPADGTCGCKAVGRHPWVSCGT